MGEDGDQSVRSTSGAHKKPSGMVVTAEEQSRRDAMDMRCLSLCIGMLERVNGVRFFVLALVLVLVLTCSYN